MVYSNINSLVHYKDNTNIDPEDVGYETVVYEMDILDKTVMVVLGKAKHTFSQRGIVFFPVYLVRNHQVHSQIGVFEVHKNKLLDIMDSEDVQEPDVSKLSDPLLYSFVNETYMDRNSQESKTFLRYLEQKETDTDAGKKMVEDMVPVIEKVNEEQEDNDETDEVMKVKVRSSQISKEIEKANVLLESGVFEKDSNVKIAALLPEESEDDAKEIKKEFAESAKHHWINTFMKNPHYDIHEVEKNGDCFFAVLRDAYKQIGMTTTVSKLRAILAKNATEKVFEGQYKLWTDLEGNIREYTQKLSKLKHTLEVELKERAEKARNHKEDLVRILEEEMEKRKEEYKDLLQQKQATEQLKEEVVGSMNGIDTLEKFREYIQTSRYWADTWAISVLERVLQVKLIILSERSYLEHDYNGVLMCGELDEDLQIAKVFTPKYYIMATHSGDHYRLITYKDKRILEFQEIPYHIKAMIINKCMERDSGAFYMIPEFRSLKKRMGLDENEGQPAAEADVEEEKSTEEYDPHTVFAFYENSAKTVHPGKATKESIPTDRQSEFVRLKKISDWRRKLDDQWTEAPFKLNGHQWASVEHYYQGSKFRKQNPDFMLQFSLDSKSEISKDVELAQGAGSKSGGPKSRPKCKKGFDMRPPHVEIDPDFYGKRSEEERLAAVRAKFTENADMKQLLLLTKNAKLVHVEKGAPVETDHILMKIRSEITQQ